jgi:MinD superfamily P-loop ATPase
MAKELVIISGKGGTGKTSIVSSFATLAQNKIMVDCDVDAADLHLILKPEILKTTEFYSGKTAEIIQDKCTKCGQCIRQKSHCLYQQRPNSIRGERSTNRR